jgi:lincosamide nucleotidyltransferase A/C/D/E
MRANQLLDLVDRLLGVTPVVWIGGGWGVDALVGRQTRPHGDLDVLLDAPSLPAARSLLDGHGFVVTEDWLPVRIEVAHPDGRRVDLHPVTFAEDGSGIQPGLDGTVFVYPVGCTTTGYVDGRPVTCLTAAQQLVFRQGFPLRPVDHHDITLLRGLSYGPGGAG